MNGIDLLFTVYRSPFTLFLPDDRQQVRRPFQPVIRLRLPPDAPARRAPTAPPRCAPRPPARSACRGCCRPRRPWWPDRRRAGAPPSRPARDAASGFSTSSAQTSTSMSDSSCASASPRSAPERFLLVTSPVARPSRLSSLHHVHHAGIDGHHPVVMLQVVLPVGGDQRVEHSGGVLACDELRGEGRADPLQPLLRRSEEGDRAPPGCGGSCPGSGGPNRSACRRGRRAPCGACAMAESIGAGPPLAERSRPLYRLDTDQAGTNSSTPPRRASIAFVRAPGLGR